MRLLEHEAKQLLAEAGIPIPRETVVSVAEEAVTFARSLNAPVVLKAQVPVGGRMKAGGVLFAATPEAVERAARKLLGMTIRGYTVERISVQEQLKEHGKFYLAATFDAAERSAVLLASAEGGIDVESARQILRQTFSLHQPYPLFRARELAVQLLETPGKPSGTEAGASPLLIALADIIFKVARFFQQSDALLVEINPLLLTVPPPQPSHPALHPAGQAVRNPHPNPPPFANSANRGGSRREQGREQTPLRLPALPALRDVSPQGGLTHGRDVSPEGDLRMGSELHPDGGRRRGMGVLIAVDAHIELDDDALFRHKEWMARFNLIERGERKRTPLEQRATEIDAADHRGVAGRVVEFDGDLALLIGGGGASLTIFDAILDAGGKPANYCEIGGNPSVWKIAELTQLLLSKPGVKRLAVIMNVVNNTRVDLVARGVIKGIVESGRNPSEVIAAFRIPGSWEEEGIKILKKYGVRYFGREVSLNEVAAMVAMS